MHAGQVGALQVHRRRALREDARDHRPRPHRLARRRARPRLRHEAHRLRPLHLRGARRQDGRHALRDGRRAAAAGRLHHRAPAQDQGDHRHVRRRAVREDEGRRARWSTPPAAASTRCDALADALRSGKVAGAGIDVFEVEPCTDSPLIEFDNVVLTPHLGASTAEAQDRAGEQIAEYVAARPRGPHGPDRRQRRAGARPRSWRRSAPTSTSPQDLGTHARAARARRRRGARHPHRRRAGRRRHPHRAHRRAQGPAHARERRGRQLRQRRVPRRAARHHASPRPSAPRRTTTSRCSSCARSRRTGRSRSARRSSARRTSRASCRSSATTSTWRPRKNMAFFVYPDRPGMIGKVGTIARRRRASTSVRCRSAATSRAARRSWPSPSTPCSSRVARAHLRGRRHGRRLVRGDLADRAQRDGGARAWPPRGVTGLAPPGARPALARIKGGSTSAENQEVRAAPAADSTGGVASDLSPARIARGAVVGLLTMGALARCRAVQSESGVHMVRRGRRPRIRVLRCGGRLCRAVVSGRTDRSLHNPGSGSSVASAPGHASRVRWRRIRGCAWGVGLDQAVRSGDRSHPLVRPDGGVPLSGVLVRRAAGGPVPCRAP